MDVLASDLARVGAGTDETSPRAREGAEEVARTRHRTAPLARIFEHVLNAYARVSVVDRSTITFVLIDRPAIDTVTHPGERSLPRPTSLPLAPSPILISVRFAPLCNARGGEDAPGF